MSNEFEKNVLSYNKHNDIISGILLIIISSISLFIIFFCKYQIKRN